MARCYAPRPKPGQARAARERQQPRAAGTPVLQSLCWGSLCQAHAPQRPRSLRELAPPPARPLPGALPAARRAPPRDLAAATTHAGLPWAAALPETPEACLQGLLRRPRRAWWVCWAARRPPGAPARLAQPRPPRALNRGAPAMPRGAQGSRLGGRLQSPRSAACPRQHHALGRPGTPARRGGRAPRPAAQSPAGSAGGRLHGAAAQAEEAKNPRP